MTEIESGILGHWSRWGSDGYPIEKRHGKWFVDGMFNGRGASPIAYKTKREATTQWEAFIDSLISQKGKESQARRGL
jgi:hypothetical protein